MAVPWTPIVVALLGMFQFGVALVIVNTMLDDLSEDLGFDESVGGGVATSALFLGAGVGSLVTGVFDRVLAEYGQTCIGLLFATGNVLCAVSTGHKLCWGGAFDGCVPNLILTGRLVVGFASGLTVVNSPRFLVAVSPAEIRGSVGACAQVSVALGAFLGLLIGLPFEVDSFDIGYEWWRIMFFIATAPALLQCFLTASSIPTFRLVLAEAKNGPSVVESKEISELEMIEIGKHTQSKAKHSSVDLSPEVAAASPPKNDSPSIYPMPELVRSLSVVFEKRYRHSVILGVGVPVFCQLSGINIIGAYSTAIFEEAGLDLAVIGSVLFGLGNLVSSSISAFVCDQCNRKTLANVTFAGMAVSCLALALSDLADSSIAGPLSVVFVQTFVLSFGAGCGFLTVGYAPEVVPPELADVVLGAGQSLSIFLSLLLVLVFPSVLDALGVLGTFAILAVGPIAAFVFFKVYMVETRGRDLKSIVESLTAPQQQ